MEWKYYTCQQTKASVDAILADIASVFANLDCSLQARHNAKEYEKKRLAEIAELDPHFADRCGWDNPDQAD